MITQLKYLISLLLVLGLTVNDTFGYVQISATNYHQSYKTSSLKKFRSQNTKLGAFKQHKLVNNYFLIFFIPNTNLKSVFQKQIQLRLKQQKQLFQKIAAQNIQHTFLRKRINSKSSKPNVYIA